MKSKKATRLLTLALLAGGVLLNPWGGGYGYQDLQLYKVTEFVLQQGPGARSNPAISDHWAAWVEPGNNKVSVFDLQTNQILTVSPSNLVGSSIDVGSDILVTIEATPDFQQGIFGYRLPSLERFTISPPKGDTNFYRKSVSISGNIVVWAEGSGMNYNFDIWAHDLISGREFSVVAQTGQQDQPWISGNTIIWFDARHALDPTSFLYGDIYAYDLSRGQERRLTTRTQQLNSWAVSGNTVVWIAYNDNSWQLQAYNLVEGREFTVREGTKPYPYGPMPLDVDISGDLVVWTNPGADNDIYGYDLRQSMPFIVTRAIGNQGWSRISGLTVVWVDNRNAGVGKYEYQADIYGARLEAGSAPPPPAIGAPSATDAKIEILWPHGGAPVTEADQANISAWLFYPGTLDLTPCQWNPEVQLWRSLNNGPAQLVALGGKWDLYYLSGRAIPTWTFNNINVSEARDPNNRLYFFVTVKDTIDRSNVWTHAADARTYFPTQDTPIGVTPFYSSLDARIEIVWPHDNAPVAEATMVNVTAMIFAPGTLLSIPPDQNLNLYLLRSSNNGVAERVAEGTKRIVQGRGFTYPVWDFNNIDVSAATDPTNKYYFRLEIDRGTTFPNFTNVWAHGADARTYFPQMDTPTSTCR
ncbi:MAG: hypothetical protein HY664_03360 [Chloroflexi bacterium]|nr:hypothetical protein [Chloroflexota bacterium]